MANPVPSDVNDDMIIVFVLYNLMDRDYVETAHCLERESGIYFNIQYFEELIMDGRYEDAEFYVLGFTSVEENRYSTKILFDIKRLKLLEALDDGAKRLAEDIVRNEFPQFNEYNRKLYEQALELVSIDNIRSHVSMMRFDKKEARKHGVEEMKKCIRGNPALRGKLSLPPRETTMYQMMMMRAQRLAQMGTPDPFVNWNTRHFRVNNYPTTTTAAATATTNNNNNNNNNN